MREMGKKRRESIANGMRGEDGMRGMEVERTIRGSDEREGDNRK